MRISRGGEHMPRMLYNPFHFFLIFFLLYLGAVLPGLV